MNPGAALAFVATIALAWRAGATLLAEAERLAAPNQPTWRQRLLEPTDARIQRTFGDGAAILFALRAAAPRPALVLVAPPVGDLATLTPERFAALDRRNGLVVQLQTLAYPDPWLQEAADPYGVAAGLASAGRDARVLQLAGDAGPADAGAWDAVALPGGGQLWRRR